MTAAPARQRKTKRVPTNPPPTANNEEDIDLEVVGTKVLSASVLTPGLRAVIDSFGGQIVAVYLDKDKNFKYRVAFCNCDGAQILSSGWHKTQQKAARALENHMRRTAKALLESK